LGNVGRPKNLSWEIGREENLGDLGVDGRIILNWIGLSPSYSVLKKRGHNVSGSGYAPVFR